MEGALNLEGAKICHPTKTNFAGTIWRPNKTTSLYYEFSPDKTTKTTSYTTRLTQDLYLGIGTGRTDGHTDGETDTRVKVSTLRPHYRRGEEEGKEWLEQLRQVSTYTLTPPHNFMWSSQMELVNQEMRRGQSVLLARRSKMLSKVIIWTSQTSIITY